MISQEQIIALCQLLDSIDCCDGYTIPDNDYHKFWDAIRLARELLKTI